MVCPMENECINACSRSVIMQSTTGDQKGMIQLTPTRTMHSIYSEVAKEFGCGIDEIEITMQHGANVVSSHLFFILGCMISITIFCNIHL